MKAIPMIGSFLRRISPWAFLIVLATAAGQSTHEPRTITVNGHAGHVTIYRIDGRSFVDIESLVRIANGSINLAADPIVLTFPAAEAATPEAILTGQDALSRDFMGAAVQTLAMLNDWVSKLAYAARNGIPGDGSRIFLLRDRAAEALNLARISAVSESDSKALQLVTAHFNTISSWSDELIRERQRAATAKYSISDDALQRDETYQKINACMHFLDSMLPGGRFEDSSFCH